VQTPFIPTTYDQSALALLTAANQALAQLETAESDADKQASYYLALESLIGLYQLHGCSWALPALHRLYARADCPELYIGYSADGRVRLRVELMELRNPAFESYTFYLVTLECNSAKTLHSDEWEPMTIALQGGKSLIAERIHAQHALWPNLRRIADTFEPTRSLEPTLGKSFKQVYAVKVDPAQIENMRLVWGGYSITVPVSKWVDGS
jgi:hypothetical protein